MIHIYVNIFEDKVDFHIMEYGKREIYKIKENEIILPISFSIGDKLSYIKEKLIKKQEYFLKNWKIQCYMKFVRLNIMLQNMDDFIWIITSSGSRKDVIQTLEH